MYADSNPVLAWLAMLGFLLLSLSACQPPQNLSAATENGGDITQLQLDALAASLNVRYTVLDNLVKGRCGTAGRCFSAEIDLITDIDIPFGGWQLYFSQLFPLHQVESDDFIVETVNGDLKRIVPSENYSGFRRGESKTLILYLAGTHGNEYEAMPNYYVVAGQLEARLVQSTVPVTDPDTGLEVMPHITHFTDANRQFRITENEKVEWATSSVLYAANHDMFVDPAGVDTAIVPTPLEVDIDVGSETLDLASGIRLSLHGLGDKPLRAALDRLARLGIRETEAGVPVSVTVAATKDTVPGSYSLVIGDNAIGVQAGDTAGAFYALQSVASLLRAGVSQIPRMKITDEPRFEFRGMHIDVSRNFHSRQLILTLIEQMAAYKLNKLHLHLGDDEGWRLAIPGLPELTDIGSKRCHDLSESSCLLPQLGSGPHGDTAVNGYYSVKDYQEILTAATARHIQVIPSFDMPGHSRAAVKSMEARYRMLLATGDEQAAKKYLLSDLEDRSVYSSIQNYTDNTINVCMESPFVFVDKVVSEMQRMHAEAGHPLTRYHIGADETAGAWRQSPACERFFASNEYGVTGPEQLGAYFVERFAALLARKGIETAGWGDGMGHTALKNMPQVVQSNAWGRLVDPAHVAAHEHVNIGWDVVVSVPDVTYFDFPYEADPQERGYSWASRQTNSRKVFEFMPENLPAHAAFWTDAEGLGLNLSDHRPMQRGKGFAGMQGQIWSETLRSDDQVEYMVFPRMLALAERAWHAASWEIPYDYNGADYNPESGHFTDEQRQRRDREWNRFANVIAGKELAKLDQAGVAYRIPTVGAVIIAGKLHCNLILPGLGIEYRPEGGAWRSYTGPVDVGGEIVEVRAVSADGGRKGRPLKVF